MSAAAQQEEDAKLRRIFKHFDSDNSGHIDTKELKGIVEKLGIKLDNENMLVLMKRYDEDNNGRLSEDEFWYVFHWINRFYGKINIQF